MRRMTGEEVGDYGLLTKDIMILYKGSGKR
jgi:hypothetical protein